MDKKIVRLLQILAGIGVLFLLLNHGKQVVGLLTPVFIALFFSLLLTPAVDFLNARIKSRLVSTLLVTIPVLVVLMTALWWGINRIYREAESFVRSFPSLTAVQELFYEHIWPLVEGTRFEDSMNTLLEDIIFQVFDFLQGLAGTIISSGISIIGTLPGLFAAIMVTIVMTFFLIYDKKWLLNLFPNMGVGIDKVIKSIHGFIKAQVVLVTMTAIICMVTFSFLGIPYILALGLVIAVLDILPIVGAGTLLVPMVFWYLITGNPFTAFMIALIYVVILVVRQVAEPKLLSQNLGIHPIVAVLAVFLGLKLFGVFGLILLPLIAAVAAGFPRFHWLRR